MQHAFLQSTGRTFLDFAMCGVSALTICRESICLQAVSPAKTSAAPEGEPASMASDPGCGPNSLELFASYDPDTSLWRTLQLSFIPFDAESVSSSQHRSEVFLGTWPRAGMTRSGNVFRRPPLVLRISETGCSLWPTPVVPNGGRSPRGGMSPSGMTPDGKKRQVDLQHAVRMVEARMWPTPNATDGSKAPKFFPRGNPSLPQAVNMFPTPTASDAAGGPAYSRPPSQEGSPTLKESTPGALNPMWVEWLMGFPAEWTDLEDLETP
jgi:hypothetical protein